MGEWDNRRLSLAYISSHDSTAFLHRYARDLRAFLCFPFRPDHPKTAADQYRAAHEQQILQEFTSLLAIP